MVQSKEHKKLVEAGNEKAKSDKAFAAQVEKEVNEIINGDSGVLGPSYDEMNARLMSKQTTSDLELLQFREYKNTLRK